MIDLSITLAVIREVCPNLGNVAADETFDNNGVGTYELHEIVTRSLDRGHIRFPDWPFLFDTRFHTPMDLAEAISCE